MYKRKILSYKHQTLNKTEIRMLNVKPECESQDRKRDNLEFCNLYFFRILDLVLGICFQAPRAM